MGTERSGGSIEAVVDEPAEELEGARSGSEEAITWIHLSDFHAGQPGKSVWPQVDTELQRSVVGMADRLGVPDLVLFTGDLANRGGEDEYRQVDELLGRLEQWLGRELPVLAVPGNHDLVRPKKLWDYSWLHHYEEDARLREALWSGDDDLWERLDRLFPHYADWMRRRVVTSLEQAGWRPHVSSRMPGDLSVVVEKRRIRLGLVGLNSAWTHLSDGAEGRLQLPVEQFHLALPPSGSGNPLDWFEGVDAALLLTHHPHGWLSETAQKTYRAAIHDPGRFSLALFGHMHEGRSEVVSVSGAQPRAFFQAPSLFGIEHYGEKNERRVMGYAWGRITSTGEIRVWPCKRVPRGSGHYVFDRDQEFDEVEDELGGVVLVPGKANEAASRARSHRASGPASGARDPLTPEELATYREAVRACYGVTHFIGFPNPIEYGMTWEQLYVELDMVKAHGHSKQELFVGADLEGADGPEKERKKVGLDDAFGYAERCTKRAMVLLGDPGSGKTTQLEQMLLRVLDEERGPGSLGLPEGTVPVFVPIRELSPLLPPEGPLPKLEQLVAGALPETLGAVSEALAARLLGSERVLYLLDGLDEIPDPAQRARMAKVIANAQRRLGKHYLMVSSRYAGYADIKAVHLGNAFLELRLEGLDNEQVKRLVHNWHQAVEAMDAREAGRAASREAAEQQADEMLERLQIENFEEDEEHNRLAQMARTPLLLTALCLIHRERASRGGLPSDRSEIYGTCEEILLEHWQREVKGREVLEHWQRTVDGREEGFDAVTARRVLQPVAYWLHREDERRHATVSELRGSVERGLREVGRTDVPADGFVRSFASESGLLTPYGPERHGFIHLGFQEHLAALHVRERWAREPEVRDDFVGRCGEGWWREVSRMVLERAEPGLSTAFVEQVVGRPELEVWSRTRMMEGCLRASAGSSMEHLAALLRKPAGAVGVERQMTAVRLLVQQVVPELPAAMVEELDAHLREHPVEAVRRRWLEQAKPGGALKTKVVAGVELVLVPGGWFSMGSPEDDEMAWDDERPQHEVELGSFWLARTPVTNAQYREYMEANAGVKEPENWGDRRYNQDGQPVVGVSWEEAKAYCEWAGLGLPTEAQWEYACRAGTTTRYWSGDGEADLAKVGWYDGNSDGRLHAVGELEANAWGLYDMHGNVWEWCRDAPGSYAASPRAGDGLRHEPVGDANRVIRGGSFIFSARYARSAYRLDRHPDVRSVVLGFRPAQGHS